MKLISKVKKQFLIAGSLYRFEAGNELPELKEVSQTIYDLMYQGKDTEFIAKVLNVELSLIEKQAEVLRDCTEFYCVVPDIVGDRLLKLSSLVSEVKEEKAEEVKSAEEVKTRKTKFKAKNEQN